MNTIFKHKILAGLMLFGALTLATSCQDTEGLEVTSETPFADKTLLEVINADPELSDFVEVLNSCGAECADSLFNSSRVYTLWAPTNGSFKKDSIMDRIAAGYRDHVFKTFVMSHIANHLNAATGTLDSDNKILLLNGKVVVFEGDRVGGYKFDGCTVVERNIRVWNGLIHKLESPSNYKYSIWEYLKLDSRIDSVANFLYSYDVTEFNAGLSILGPIKDGVQTYLDSVSTTSNKLLSAHTGIGNLDKEDSLYTVYIPTNEVWKELMLAAKKHYNYNYSAKKPASMDSTYRDSLSNFYSRMNIIKYMTFSNNEQKYVKSPDSVMPVNRSGYPRKLFAKSQFLQNIIDTKQLSNGVVKIVNKSPYNMFELWHDTIALQGENDGMRLPDSQGGQEYTVSVNQNNINKKDSLLKDVKLSGGRYFACESSNSSVIVTYKVPKVLSANYKVAMVVVPKHITNSSIDPAELLPTCFTIDISQNSQRLYQVKEIENDPTRVDTLYLTDTKGQPLTVSFPYCEYFEGTNSRDDFSVEFKITSKRNPKKYDSSVRIDEIIFVPVGDQE